MLNGTAQLKRLRTVGKVKMLQDAIDADPTHGKVGIAHTRWATHGVPSERNAHPHVSHDGLAIVHNGIIENHEELREDLSQARLHVQFRDRHRSGRASRSLSFAAQKDLFKAVRATVAELEGAYALAVVSEAEPERIILAREGCPVVVGLGVDENFVASDVAALLPVTRRLMSWKKATSPTSAAPRSACSTRMATAPAARCARANFGQRRGEGAIPPLRTQGNSRAAARRRGHAGRTHRQGPVARSRVRSRGRHIQPTEHVHIIACGTSYHSGVVARYFIEQICKLPSAVEIASECRYRNPVVPRNSLFVTISQSGETAERWPRCAWRSRRAIFQPRHLQCPRELAVRESELVILMRAGPEIGRASTKAFTTKLAALSMLVIALAKNRAADASASAAWCSAS